MKYGLLVWKNTDNIGDDIQSYAARRFLPQVDYYVDREELDTFFPKEKEKVATIMNGWFLHNKWNFPPTPYIHPLLISMHFSTGDNWTLDKKLYLDNDKSKEYLEKYGPVGARDLVTLEKLKELKIDTYLSGCMTLTIPKFEGVKSEDYICSVDLGVEKNDKLRDMYKDSGQEIRYFAQAIEDIDKNSRLSYEQRFSNVETLLKKYQASKGVVTSRLHCALPCIALGVPVVLIYNENSYDRLATFKNLIPMYTEEEFFKLDKIEFNTNQEEVDKIKQNLINKCEEFIRESSNVNEDDLISIEEYKRVNNIEELKLKERIMKIEIDDRNKDLKWYREEIDRKNSELDNKNREISRLEESINNLEKEISNFKYSRLYKIYKLRNK